MLFENKYLNYNEYRSIGGKLQETPFNLLEYESRKRIDKYTYGRLKNLNNQIEEVKACVYLLIDEMSSDNKQKNKSSQSVGSYSVNYIVLKSDEKERKYKSIIEDNLSECRLSDGTPYLYIP